MQVSIKKLVAVTAVTLLACAGCQKAPSVDAPVAQATPLISEPPATLKTSLHVTAKAPDGWYVMSDSTTQAMMEQGKDLVAGDNKMLQAAAKSAVRRTGQLFGYMRVPPGSPTDDNPSVLGMMESLKAAPGVKTGRDYFFHVQKLWAMSTIQPKVLRNDESRKIDGDTFDQIDVQIDLPTGDPVFQSYYAAREGDDIVFFIQSWKTDKGKAETGAIIDSIKLGK